MIIKGHMFRLIRQSLAIKVPAFSKALTQESYPVLYTSKETIYKIEREDIIVPPVWIKSLCKVASISMDELNERALYFEPQVNDLYKQITKPNYPKTIVQKRQTKIKESFMER